MGETNFPKLAAPAMRALNGAGYTNLEQLTEVTESELAQLHGMGPKAVGILKDALASNGLSFADSPKTGNKKDIE